MRPRGRDDPIPGEAAARARRWRVRRRGPATILAPESDNFIAGTPLAAEGVWLAQ